MCGIAGVAGRPPHAESLQAAADAMRQRGPDGGGLWLDGDCGLAFRRLAIIDLDERSDQPLHLDALHLVFNGEIYNYIELRDELRALGHDFVTEGDGEVLLHAWKEWGEGALDRIDGMFAFAVWDDRARRLAFAVDPFGEKPLLLRELADGLAFASSARALQRLDPSVGAPDEEVVAGYLTAGAMPVPPRTFFAGVQRVPAAHAGTWDRAGGLRLRRYWTPAPRALPPRYEDAVAELRELLTGSVRRRLRSDVPVGTSLSGGVDSSATIALAAMLGPDARRHAFTARFPGFARDEWEHAHAAAQRAEVLHHHAVEPTLETLLGGDLERLVADQEEPFPTTSIYAQWCVNRAAHDAGVVVLLDGQGADELFAGYPGLLAFAAVQSGPRAALGAAVRGRVGAGMLAQAAVAGRTPAPVARYLRRREASPYASAAVARGGARRDGAAPPRQAGALRRELLVQAFASSLPSLLRYADRSSMAHSREVRLPFLDRQVAEFALSCPPGFLFRGGRTKAVLRDAVSDIVPAVVLDRRDKVGFETPEQRWFADERMRRFVSDMLLDPAARARDLLRIERVGDDVRGGAWRDRAAIWRALNLELWLRAWT